MTLRWLLASLHLLGLGIGLGSVIVRGAALRSRLDQQTLRWVFAADSLWGVAALLWIGTGLWRVLGETEKPTGYYLQNHIFLTKMAAFIVLFLLELRPIATLTTWRRKVARGEVLQTSAAPLLSRISFWQGGLVVLIVFLATAMARGYGA